MSDEYRYNTYKEIGEFHIFNQQDFTIKNELSPKDPPVKFREGSKHDVASLQKAALFLGFKCDEETIHTDLKREEIQRKLIKFSKQDFSDSYCFACAILTHGGTKGRLATSDDEIYISKFEKEIKENEFLFGKPKMIFIQACRGPIQDKGKKIISKDGHTDDIVGSPTGDQDNEEVCIPTGSDFLIYHSTMDDHSASLHPKTGSIFIQTLSANLKKYGREMDLLKILTRVNHDVAVESKKDRKQTPVISSRLRKDVYFCTREESTAEYIPESEEPKPKDVLINSDQTTGRVSLTKSFLESSTKESKLK